MTSATDVDIREIKDLIAAGNAATQKQIADSVIVTQKQIADLDKKIEVGLAKIDGELKEVANRLVAVENNVKGLDGRLWGFGGTILAAVLAALLTIFGRYIFTGLPIVQ